MNGPREIAGLDALRALAGQEVAVSDWIRVDQDRVDAFADATLDRQWIHVDPERARRESPFGGTIAHGYLTLSLLPALLERTLRLAGDAVHLNYGLNKLRFPAPLPVGARIRARFTLLAVRDVPAGAQIEWQATVETEAGGKPVCVADLLYLRQG